MFIKQISVYLENVKGALREMLQILSDNGVNLLAISIADTTGFGIIRLIVKGDDTEKAAELLKQAGHVAKVHRVVGISIAHQPGGLVHVLQTMEDNDLGVEYTYSFCKNSLDDAVIVIRPTDYEKCIQVLTDAGIKLVTQNEVDTF